MGDVIDRYRSFIGTSLQSRFAFIRLLPERKNPMKQSQIFRENAENCAQLADGATSEPVFNRYKRMEAAWRALANEQDWLDGEVAPARIAMMNGHAPIGTGAL
jgi:hypothetical protein